MAETAAPPAPPAGPSFATPEPPGIFAEIDRVSKPHMADPLPDKPTEKPAAKIPDKPADKPVEKPAELEKGKVEDKPADKPAPADKTTDKPGDKPAEIPSDKMAPKQLREAYEGLKKKLKEYEGKKPEALTDHPEYKSLAEKHEAATKKLEATTKAAEELENKIRFLDYEQSTEFLEKFRKPYVETWKAAAKELSQLSVPTFDAEGNDTGKPRKATIDDLAVIFSEPDTERALDMAEKLFNNSTKANYAMTWRDKIISASNAQEQARAEFKEKGAAISKEQAERQAESNKAEAQRFSELNKEWSEKNPNFVVPDEGDEKGREAIELGTKAADMAFGDTSHLSPQQRAKLYADTRNRAASFGLVAHKLDAAMKQNEELKAKLAEYEESQPGKGDPARDITPGEETMEQKIDRIAKK